MLRKSRTALSVFLFSLLLGCDAPKPKGVRSAPSSGDGEAQEAGDTAPTALALDAGSTCQDDLCIWLLAEGVEDDRRVDVLTEEGELVASYSGDDLVVVPNLDRKSVV